MASGRGQSASVPHVPPLGTKKIHPVPHEEALPSHLFDCIAARFLSIAVFIECARVRLLRKRDFRRISPTAGVPALCFKFMTLSSACIESLIREAFLIQIVAFF